MKSTLIFLSVLFTSATGLCQPLQGFEKVRSSLVIRQAALPVIGDSYAQGRITLTPTRFIYESDSCTDSNGLYNFYYKLFPCNNYLVKDINVAYDQIARVTRRNALLIWPNRLQLTTRDGRKYMFLTWKRRKLFKAIKEGMETTTALSFQE
jgi:hypothetical protein